MAKIRLFFCRQFQHYLILSFLLAGLYLAAKGGNFLTGDFLGVGTPVWFWSCVIVAIAHQTYVWLSWRSELHYALITRLFKARGFSYYCVVFFFLLSGRLVFVFILAWSNRGALNVPYPLLYAAALIFTIPVIYLFYSIRRYFGFKRAAGIDHFDASYRNTPLVRKGIFKFCRNPMYTFGMLILWLPGLIFASKAALLAAVFQHVYAWVHYYCTEKPDLRLIHLYNS